MTTLSTTLADTPVLPQNQKPAAVWNAGGQDYDRISRQIADAIDHCVDRLDPKPGERVLDLATGTGWTARRVAERGAQVTGVDLGADLIDAATRLDPTGQIDFRVGDAESLPFADQSFDAVVSTFGLMFCGDPARAAAEMARVCRPGGRFALAVWADHDGVFELFKVISRHKPAAPAGAPSPFGWAKPERIAEWLGPHFDYGVEAGVSLHRERCSDDAWDAFSGGYGPVKCLVESLDADALEEFRRDFLVYHQQRVTPLGVLVERPYLIIAGVNRPA